MTKLRERDKFNKAKKIINIISKLYSLLPYSIRLKLFDFHRTTRGNIGLVIRYALLKSTAKSCGDNVAIFQDVYIFKVNNLSIGNNVSIHPMCYIDATGNIDINNDVSIAHGTTILSSSHNYTDTKIPIKDQGMTLSKTYINNNVWIGAKVTILSGITINSGCIIGANSVVTKNTKENSIVAGVPAKLIKMRQ